MCCMTTTEKTAIKFLFISFSGLLCALKSGKVSVKDLTHGLFYFGRTRAQALNPTDEGLHQLKILAHEYARGMMKGERSGSRPESIEQVLKGAQHSPSPTQREQGWVKARALHQHVVDAVLLAEKEGRIQWRTEGGVNSYEDLNVLLKAHKLPPVRPADKS